MSAGVMYDAPGPKTIARHRAYTLLSIVAIVALVGFFVWRLYDSGQLTAEKWEVFTTPAYIKVLLVDGLLQTLKMAGFAIVFAVVFGTVFGIGKLSDHAIIRWPSWLIVEFFRAVPVLLLMVFVWYFLGIQREASSFWAVVIALTFYNGAVLAEVLRAGVLAVPTGQSEAAYAVGMRKSQTMMIVLMPQAVKIMLPAIISQCVVALKDTALGLYVVAPGLTSVSKRIYLEFHNQVPTIIVVAALYIIVNLILTALATWAQKRFVGEKKQLTVAAQGSGRTGGRVTT